MKRLAVRTKRHYDSKVKDVVFHVGDWVWVYSPRRYIGRSPKWSKQYGGPFLIEKVINAVNYATLVGLPAYQLSRLQSVLNAAA